MGRRSRVVIIGAGFAGLTVTQRLAHTTFDVLLINHRHFHTFQPLLPQVATAELEPNQGVYPIRRILRRFPNVQFVMADVTHLETAERWIATTAGRFTYDFLVLATGSEANIQRVPSVAHHAYPLKTIDDAIALHRQVQRCFETALQATAPQKQRLLTVAIMGGGPTGVELAADITDCSPCFTGG